MFLNIYYKIICNNKKLYFFRKLTYLIYMKNHVISNNPIIIVALDYNNLYKTLSFVDKINPKDCKLKIGIKMFTLFGLKLIQILHKKGFKIFLDLKFNDIPSVVSQAIKTAADNGIWMINVHANGGEQMMQESKKVLYEYGSEAPLLIGVTVLTSMTQQDLQKIGIKKNLVDYTLQLISLIKKCKLDGAVCSGHEIKTIRSIYKKNFLLVTPGIRLTSNEIEDQKRIIDPIQAIKIGANYIVIGRPITNSENPELELHKINNLIKNKN